MRNLIWLVALSATYVACGSSGNKNGDAPKGGSDSKGSGSDSGSGTDSGPVPAMITISGTATERSLGAPTVVKGAVIGAYTRAAPTTVVVMTTSDGSGNFTMNVPTGGVALDGFLMATGSNAQGSAYLDTYLWPPAPLTANFGSASVNFVTSGNLGTATGLLCGVNGGQVATDAAIGLEVLDSAGSGVGGATVTASPAAAKYCYDSGSGSNALPSAAATSTDTDGVALLINVPAGGEVSLTASESGDTFNTHSVIAVANAFVTTIVEKQ